jgi:hypothetical protein
VDDATQDKESTEDEGNTNMMQNIMLVKMKKALKGATNRYFQKLNLAMQEVNPKAERLNMKSK